jgi:2-oxoglutarate ferredoxin oxidoreductase subunit beta
VLSPCPTNWGVDPDEAINWMESTMMPEYPLGVFRDVAAPEVKK